MTAGTLDIGEPAEIACGGASLVLRAPDTVVLRGAAGVRETRLPDLASSTVVAFHRRGGRVLLVGGESGQVWLARPDALSVEPVARLARLDFAGRYDPGGLRRVAFHGLPDGGVLVEYEVGVARLADNGLSWWQREHDDLTARVVSVADGVVWLRGEGQPFGYRIADGLSAG